MANTEKLGAKKDSKKQGNIVTRTVDFYNKNEKIIYIVLIALLVILGGFFAFNKFYLTPKNEKAAALIVKPIEFYAKGDSASLIMALEGNDEHDGFLTIASDYSLTKAGNTANYYAALCYIKQNKKEDALEYLLKFKKKEDIMWCGAQMLIGDLYHEQGDVDKALKYYAETIKGKEAYFASIALFKTGQIHEMQDNWAKALEFYSKIENDYYKEYTRMGVDRYLERAKIKAGN